MTAIYCAEVRGALPISAVKQGSTTTSVVWFCLGLMAVIAAAMTRQMGLALVLPWIGILLIHRYWKKAIISVVACAVILGSWQMSEHRYRSTLQEAVVPTVANTLNQSGVKQVLDKSPIKLEFIKHFLVVNPVSQDKAAKAVTLSSRVKLITSNIRHYGQVWLQQILPSWKVKTTNGKINILWTPAMALLMACFMGIGAWRIRPVAGFTLAYVVMSLLVLFNYPYVSPRFLLPIAPYGLLALFLGLHQVARVLKPLGGKVAFRFTSSSPGKAGLALRWAMAWLLCPGLVWLATGHGAVQAARWVSHGHKIQQLAVKCSSDGPSRNPANLSYYQALMWLKSNAPANTLVISRKPPVTYYYSGLKSVAFPFTRDTNQLMAFIETTAEQNKSEFPQVWVVADGAFNESISLLTPAIEANIERFTLLHQVSNSETKVWRLAM